MAKVVSLDAKRAEHDSFGYDGLVCECGSAWFAASVALTKDGEVTACASMIVCVECQKEHEL